MQGSKCTIDGDLLITQVLLALRRCKNALSWIFASLDAPKHLLFGSICFLPCMFLAFVDFVLFDAFSVSIHRDHPYEAAIHSFALSLSFSCILRLAHHTFLRPPYFSYVSNREAGRQAGKQFQSFPSSHPPNLLFSVPSPLDSGISTSNGPSRRLRLGWPQQQI